MERKPNRKSRFKGYLWVEKMLTRIDLRGFKSIRYLEDFEMKDLNVFIGPNGAGKSNFISFFRLLNWLTPSPGNLQIHVADVGGANVLLHDGATVTPQLECALTFQTDQGVNKYRMRLFHAAGDTLIFAEEEYQFVPEGGTPPFTWRSLGAGQRESGLVSTAEAGSITARFILNLLRRCVVYQFHNTSKTSRMRQKWSIGDNRFLKEDGGNIAPVLYRLREEYPKHYQRIVQNVRLVAPFFGDFVLEPEGADRNFIFLRWREQGTDYEFSAPQASDGTLRCLALITLLLQPVESLPSVLILDEPELGLHPYAINLVTGLIKAVSVHCQVLIATQSETLLNYFEPKDIIIVEREGRESKFRRLDTEKLSGWLDEYTLPELWEKNVLGGRPA